MPRCRCCGDRGRPLAAWLALAVAALAVPPGLSHAQLVHTDGSLGAYVPVPKVGTDYQYTDDLGMYNATGSALFQSALYLSVDSGESITFSSSRPQPPDHLIVRVTGGERSQIYGTLRSTIPGADFFLLNPAGISFFQGAALDIQGSFYASSGDLLHFEDGISFDAGSATTPALLSIAAPSAFGFLGPDPAHVSADLVTRMTVPDGETLSFVGGDVFTSGPPEGGNLLQVRDARIQLAAAGPGVDVPIDFREFDVSSHGAGELGEVYLDVDTHLSVDGFGGSVPAGEIVIRGGRFTMFKSGLRSVHSAAAAEARGSIDIEATDSISLLGGSELLSISAGATRAADIRLVAGGGIQLAEGSTISTTTTRTGQAGDISISGRELELAGSDTAIASTIRGTGVGGSIFLEAEQLTLRDGARIATQSRSPGPGGQVVALASSATLESGASITSLAQGAGAGGAISLATGVLGVSGDAHITSVLDSAASEGVGGAIGIVAAETVSLGDGGQIRTSVVDAGSGGRVTVETSALSISNSSDRSGGTFLASDTEPGSVGRGGDVSLVADEIRLVGGGHVFANTHGAGNAGALHVRADSIFASGIDAFGRPSGLFTQAAESATGRAGDIELHARILEIEDAALISSASFGGGDAGDIRIGSEEAPVDRITLRGGPQGSPQISAEADAGPLAISGDSGELDVEVRELELLDGGQLTTRSAGRGDAGNISVHAERIRIAGVQNPVAGTSPSGIYSTVPVGGGSVDGGGGNIDVHATQEVVLESGGAISTTSFGVRRGGDIDVTAPEVEISGADPGPGSNRSGLYSNASGTTGSGDGGRITVEARESMRVKNGGKIASETSNRADGGIVHLISEGEVILKDGAEISAVSLSLAPGAGNAGRVLIDAGVAFEMTNGSRIATSSETSSGGQVEIRATDSTYLFESEIRTSVRAGELDGGQIFIDPEIVILHDSTLQASADQGWGGNITIVADNFIISRGSVIDASSNTDLREGVIRIESPNTTIAGDLVPLPEGYLDVSPLVANPCLARSSRQGSFVVATRGELSAAPDGLLGWEVDEPLATPDPTLCRHQ